MVNFNINNITSSNKILLLRNYHGIALPKTGLYSLTKKKIQIKMIGPNTRFCLSIFQVISFGSSLEETQPLFKIPLLVHLTFFLIKFCLEISSNTTQVSEP